MNRLMIVIAIVLLITSTAALGQEWSAEQKEVWKVVEEQVRAWCAGDMETNAKYIHPDFVFWNNNNAIPGDRETAIKLDTTWYGSGAKFLANVTTPLTILVYDDFAVVNFYARGYLQQPGGQPVWSTAKLSNVWKKEGGKWLLLSVTAILPEQ